MFNASLSLATLTQLDLPSLSALTAVLLSTGCANRQEITALSGGISVHSFRRDYTTSFVVAKGSDFFLVDTGYEKDGDVLVEDLRDAGFDPDNMKAVLLTHGHHDHAGAAAMLRERFRTPVIVGAADERLLQAGTALDPLCPTDAIARRRVEEDQAARFTGLAADIEVVSSLPLEPITGVPGTVTVLPGHTEGSLVISVADAAFVGDLFRGAIGGSSAEVHFYMCDLEDNRRDVQDLLDRIAPGAEIFFTGHFGPVRRGAVAERFSGP
jgi:glyoxylase-like metal-dependent hydrolase (beta-lactamase superfamily II)